MATINFFRIEAYDKKGTELLDIDINSELINILKNTNNENRLCKKNKCKASLSDYIINKEDKNKEIAENVTYDFSKLSDEYVNSVLISNTLKNTDTLKELNMIILDNTVYSQEEFDNVKEVFKSNMTFSEYLKDLLNLKIDNLFSIYKIILDLKINIKEEDISFDKYFYESQLNRLKKSSTFFNLIKYDKHTHILSLLKNTSGYDYRQLTEYLNYYIFKDFKIIINKIYDVDFLNIISNSDLKSFAFTLKYQDNNLINNPNNNIIKAFKDMVGMSNNQTMKIELSSDKNHQLNNDKILEAYEFLVDNGLVSNIKAKKMNDRSYVDSSSQGALLSYTSNYKDSKLIEDANRIFLDAYDKKYTNILDILNS